MKKFRRIAVLALALCFAMGTASVYGYEHGLSVSGGNGDLSADVSGVTSLTVTSGTNATITIGDKTVTIDPPDDKYFVRGLKIAGHDNEDDICPFVGTLDVNGTGSLVKDEDADLVVAYGLKTNMIDYTIRYVDENDADLLTSETHYGVIGDQPVVSFKYVDGYLPDAYHATKKLKPDSAENVFKFTYTPVQAAEGETIIDNGGNAGGNAAAGGAAAPGNAVAPGAAAAPGAAVIGDNATPQAINDLDTPMAGVDDEEDNEGGSSIPYIIAGIIAAAIIAALAAFFAKRRREEE